MAFKLLEPGTELREDSIIEYGLREVLSESEHVSLYSMGGTKNYYRIRDVGKGIRRVVSVERNIPKIKK